MSVYDFAFVGLGTMGLPMAGRLIDAGYRVVGYDPQPARRDAMAARGALVAGSAQEAAVQAPVVMLSLPTPEVVEDVICGPSGLVHVEGAAVIVDLSTTGPDVARALASRIAPLGRTLLDCPISGGEEGAKDGTLALMLAGPTATAEALVPALTHLGKVFLVGDAAGQGQTMKLLNNLMSTCALAITSETMVLGAKCGLDCDMMLEVFNAGSGRNTATASKFPKHVLTRSFDFGMPIKLSSKDARLCLELADRTGVPMVIGSAVRQLLNITRDHLGPDVDLTEIVRVIEEWGHQEVKGAAAR
ncbi:NAD(P)-dependent oxidoreductase [Pararhodobacter sp. SW119]|uniref:NAD(P)-dependent oxidoreductase n=1 Tax=Pararhodobacter sp. SW119 TaxID=2780075 RepID=UPI001AE054BA|nr:NAD(P)-dependent oxidoreductase [Pararhodobacter sp. SW119]